MKSTLESLSKKELLNVIRMFSKNWLTLDGLWFTLVEDKYGIEAALDLDLKMWHKSASIKARRIKENMGIKGGGIKGVLNALQFMTFHPSMPHEYSMDGPDQAYMGDILRAPGRPNKIRKGRISM